jgi:hypothetical protein
MYFFRTLNKSTALYKVHNMGLRYIKLSLYQPSEQCKEAYSEKDERLVVLKCCTSGSQKDVVYLV